MIINIIKRHPPPFSVFLRSNMNKQNQRISDLSDRLYQASREIRILTHLGWSSEIRETFFRNKEQRLPEVTYPRFEPSNVMMQIAAIQAELGGSIIDQWLNRQANVIANSALMLSSVGTEQFYKYSRELYGAPDNPLTDGMSTSLSLAQQFDEIIESLSHIDLGAPQDADRNAEEVVKQIQIAVEKAFGDDAPEVYAVDELSANALAGPTRIRVRAGANFTDRDVVQLIHHEAHIHVGTALNGRHQDLLPMLKTSHAGTTRTQEGLAVFAEFITGTMDIDRMRRLSDRVLGIQMAIDGADFIEVYRYFVERVKDKEQAFENTRRVFRGGVITGGAPFTKDNVYLNGLLRVHNFFRAIVSTNRVDCLPLMFCGKLDLEDIPVLSQLAKQGLLKQPKYLPPWASDKRFLLSYLAYSSFLNRIDMQKVKEHYNELLDEAPKIDWS